MGQHSRSSTTAMVALLRGINVGGNRKVPMKELRDVAEGLGFERVETYIQSGNLIFGTPRTAEAAAVALEKAIEERFGFTVPAIVRTATEWARYSAGSPFPDAAAERPNMLHLGLSRQPPRADALALLRAAARTGERVEIRGDAVWIDFAGGVATSKLSPAAIDKAVGSPVTARNWRTVLKLKELLENLEETIAAGRQP